VRPAADGHKELTRTSTGNGYQIEAETALERTTTYEVTALEGGGTRRVVTRPDGTSTTEVSELDASMTSALPTGDQIQRSYGPDPRFGMRGRVVETETTTSPGNLVSTTSRAREVVLDDPANPLSLLSQTDTTILNGRTFTSAYDATTNTLTTTTPEGRETVTEVDTQGRVAKTSRGGLYPLRMEYDAHGRLETILHGPDPSTSATRVRSFSYRDSTDAMNGYLESIPDPLGRITGLIRDAAGRLRQQVLPDERVIYFDYDANGNLTGVTPAGRPIHEFGYTPVDLMQEYLPPMVSGISAPGTAYTYNLDRQLELISRPDSGYVDFVYDTAKARLNSQVLPTGQLDYTYDNGQLHTITAADGGVLTFGYDGSLLISEAWSGTIAGSVSRTYDSDHRIETQSVNAGSTVTFTYDDDGMLESAGDLDLTPDEQTGLPLGGTLGVVTDSIGYTSFGELDTYEAIADSSTVYAAEYPDRDKLGRITTKVEYGVGHSTGGDAETYGYDVTGRLTDVYRNTDHVAHYEYDDNGNRAAGSFNRVSGLVLEAIYDNQDRLLSMTTQLNETSPVRKAVYTYTANGELQTKVVTPDLEETAVTETTTYIYDVLGNLIHVTLPDETEIDYIVDGRNRRIGKKVDDVLVQGFLYDNQLRIVAELDGSGAVIARFVYGSKTNVPDYIVKDGALYRVISDHLGSVRLVVHSGTGAIAQRMEYDEFGNVALDTASDFQPFGFAGGLLDSHSGLVRFGARDYDPSLARWHAKDPIRFDGGGTNSFAYASADPVNLIDGTGAGPASAALIIAAFCAGSQVGSTARDFTDLTGIQEQQQLVQDQIARIDRRLSKCNPDTAAALLASRQNLVAQALRIDSQLKATQTAVDIVSDVSCEMAVAAAALALLAPTF
jgi:RHS repeat-associated protein